MEHAEICALGLTVLGANGEVAGPPNPGEQGAAITITIADTPRGVLIAAQGDVSGVGKGWVARTMFEAATGLFCDGRPVLLAGAADPVRLPGVVTERAKNCTFAESAANGTTRRAQNEDAELLSGWARARYKLAGERA